MDQFSRCGATGEGIFTDQLLFLCVRRGTRSSERWPRIIWTTAAYPPGPGSRRKQTQPDAPKAEQLRQLKDKFILFSLIHFLTVEFTNHQSYLTGCLKSVFWLKSSVFSEWYLLLKMITSSQIKLLQKLDPTWIHLFFTIFWLLSLERER